jgi:peptidyl-tRNA hydrolase, PTH1 family
LREGSLRLSLLAEHESTLLYGLRSRGPAPLPRVPLSLTDWLRRLFRRGTTDPLTGLDPERTRLIVGLGNPGPEYADTRHNVGFRAVQKLAKRHSAAWQDKTDVVASQVAVIHPDQDITVVLARPQTFMNRSGQAVRGLTEFLKLNAGQMLIVYDEMDLPFGTLRLRERGSPGTHNGMRSVVSSLRTEAVPRLRVGIGQSSPGEATSHVLSEFSPEEEDSLDELIERAADAALAWAEHGAAEAMNRYNKA